MTIILICQLSAKGIYKIKSIDRKVGEIILDDDYSIRFRKRASGASVP